MALATNVALLFIAILGLRLTGQGLLSLTASTTMARVFSEGRGKALSVSGLGYPLGEGLLPMVVVVLIHAAGWRLSWGILGAVITMLLLPAMISLLREVEPLHQREIAEHKSHVRKWHLFRDLRFYLLLPGNLFLSFVLTGLFLYQVPLAEYRGWSAGTMASAFVGFALARMAFSLLIGPLIDSHGAIRLFQIILLPALAGLVFLISNNSVRLFGSCWREPGNRQPDDDGTLGRSLWSRIPRRHERNCRNLRYSRDSSRSVGVRVAAKNGSIIRDDRAALRRSVYCRDWIQPGSPNVAAAETGNKFFLITRSATDSSSNFGCSTRAKWSLNDLNCAPKHLRPVVPRLGTHCG